MEAECLDFRQDLVDLAAEAWDHQFNADVDAGKLDV
jgi:hypothetical protein